MKYTCAFKDNVHVLERRDLKYNNCFSPPSCCNKIVCNKIVINLSWIGCTNRSLFLIMCVDTERHRKVLAGLLSGEGLMGICYNC